MALVNKFLVGCDPEFVVVGPRGEITTVAGVLPHAGPVGYDHNGRVVELRPEPSKGTATLIRRLKALIDVDALKPLQKFKWRAGAYYTSTPGVPTEDDEEFDEEGDRVPARFRRQGVISLGGHVHLDVSPFVACEDIYTLNESEAHVLRIKALDHFTHRLEALDVLPKGECDTRRKRTEYGHFGDYRPQGVGPHYANGAIARANYRTEYRTMASWLFDPKVAFVCLTGAKLCAAEPAATMEALGRFHTFEGLKRLFESFRSHDHNATQVCEKVLAGGLKALQTDPDGNLRARWEALPV